MIEDPRPIVDCGRFPVKRVTGEEVVVEADVFADGTAVLRAEVLFRPVRDGQWRSAPMEPVANDRWRGRFVPDELGPWTYTLRAWVDPFATWRRDFAKRLQAGQELALERRTGCELVRGVARGSAAARRALAPWIRRLARAPEDAADDANAAALSEELALLVARHAAPHHPTRLARELPLVVDPPRARFSAWYELFPRSAARESGRHGTLRDVEAQLPYVAELGFDVLYLPPIHPIGRTARKGPNNSLASRPGDPGSPWAIGSAEGGHDAVHPELGSRADLRRLVRRARALGIEVALDVAFQTSPDHPWVREHPAWFARRPDGTIRHAENPPKQYQDIYPLDFESEAWPELWRALHGVFETWIADGVRTFRVDNPHTKSLRFWEWCLASLKERHPELVFLSEAFTRPKLLRRLAKLGFTQSYTYFPWRNSKAELTEHLSELTGSDAREYLRASQWVNTPDILTGYLQTGGRAAFLVRLVLAATLGASYGVYGPAFELCEARPLHEGSEEYRDSEKYQLRSWDRSDPRSLRHVVARLNRIRRENPALQQDRTLRFHAISDPELLCFSKTSREPDNAVLVVVNLDPHRARSGWTWLDLHALGLPNGEPYQVHDLLADARYAWKDEGNYVALDPAVMPAHVFRIRRRQRTEQDFDYYA